MGKRGPAPGSESAKRGGAATKAKYGSEHFRKLGQAGGKRTVEVLGPAGLSEAGKKGGKAVLDKYGLEHLHEIASRGGQASRS